MKSFVKLDFSSQVIPQN